MRFLIAAIVTSPPAWHAELTNLDDPAFHTLQLPVGYSIRSDHVLEVWLI